MTYQTHNPYTQTTEKAYPEVHPEQLQNCLSDLQDTFHKWKKLSLNHRIARIQTFTNLLKEYTTTLAKLMATEMGKPVHEGQAEVEKCIGICDHYITNSAAPLQAIRITPEDSLHYAPMGTILGILPWNYPVLQIIRFAIPTLIAGNTILIKPAPNVPETSLTIQRLFYEACQDLLPINTLFLTNNQVKTAIESPHINAITLTGSARAGKAIASLAGEQLKKCVLELGGSDPFIIHSDADIEQATLAGFKARNLNSGQTCIAAKRFIVHNSQKEAFISHYTTLMNKTILEDPLDPSTTMGPLARKDLLDTLIQQTQTLEKEGATLITPTINTPEIGYFYPPTLATEIPTNYSLKNDEIFGPLGLLFIYDTIDEAIALANDIPYGLGASIWTQSENIAEQCHTHILAGNIAINTSVKSMAHVPFGGCKQSGFGKELGDAGLTSFCYQKAIHSPTK